MRCAEAIHLAVFGFLTALAWVKLDGRRRGRATAIGVVGLAANGAMVFVPLTLAWSVVREWLPAAMILLVYWQAGTFFVRVDEGFQAWLERIDAWVLPGFMRWLAGSWIGRVVAEYLELAYLLCYAMVPLSVGALYLLRMGRYADPFWSVVLVPTYVSYGVLPFLQAMPPRMLNEPWLPKMPLGPVRRFNLLILKNASIHANTFPSAHVAASVSAALFLGSVAPWPVAVVFGLIAAGITVGTFVGRYHYAADAVAGTTLAALVFALRP